jgi:hypothetical protein
MSMSRSCNRVLGRAVAVVFAALLFVAGCSSASQDKDQPKKPAAEGGAATAGAGDEVPAPPERSEYTPGLNDLSPLPPLPQPKVKPEPIAEKSNAKPNVYKPIDNEVPEPPKAPSSEPAAAAAKPDAKKPDAAKAEVKKPDAKKP